MKLNLTALILTLNEEMNIQGCIESVKSIVQEIVVVDSLSKDRTVAIAQSLGARVIQNRFIGFSEQRNFALKQTGISTEWVLVLDADEKISPELALEIRSVLNHNLSKNGFRVKRRFIWNGKWIKRGYYPVWLLRLARVNHVYCEDRKLNEHLLVDEEIGDLNCDLIHEDNNGINHWHIKHLNYAEIAAREFLKRKEKLSLVDFKANKKRWLKYNLWDRLPLFVRPWLYFVFCYFIRGGFLEGWQGLSYHFLHGLWFQLLISHKIYELQTDLKTQLNSHCD